MECWNTHLSACAWADAATAADHWNAGVWCMHRLTLWAARYAWPSRPVERDDELTGGTSPANVRQERQERVCGETPSHEMRPWGKESSNALGDPSGRDMGNPATGTPPINDPARRTTEQGRLG